MKRRADTGTGIVDRTGCFLCRVDQRLRRGDIELVGVDQQHDGEAAGQGNRRKVVLRIVGQLLVQALVGRIGRGIAEQEGVAVGLRLGGCFGADLCSGTGTVLHHDLLAECRAHRSGDESCEEIGAATGCVGDDQMDRAYWIGLLRERGRRQSSTERGGRSHERAACERLLDRHGHPPCAGDTCRTALQISCKCI